MKLIRLIASPILMYVLAGVYALVLAIATFCGKIRPGPAVCANAFIMLRGLFCCNSCRLSICWPCFFREVSFKRISKGSLIFHGAFVFYLVGGRLLLTMQE